MLNRMMLAALALGLAVAGPARGLNVKFFDHKTGKEIEITKIGVIDIDEGPDGLTIKKGLYKLPARGTFPVRVSPLDIRDYQLQDDDVKPVDFPTFRAPLARVDNADRTKPKEADRLAEYKLALPIFKELIPKLGDNVRARRYVEYRLARTLFRLAVADTTMRAEATAALTNFAKDHSAGWQITEALTMLASLQEDQNDTEGVQKTYEQLAAVPGISEDIRVDSLLKAANILLKTAKPENLTNAKNKLQDLQGKLPADSPLKSKVTVYLLQCQIQGDNAKEAEQAAQQLRTLLAGSDDKVLKALGHNTLGDYFTKAKRDEDAFWEYLRVDTLYSDDRFEHSRAMYHLMRLFREVKNDANRADYYKDQLTKNPKYAGLEYTKRALKE